MRWLVGFAVIRAFFVAASTIVTASESGAEALDPFNQTLILVPEPPEVLLLVAGIGFLTVLYRRHLRGLRSKSSS